MVKKQAEVLSVQYDTLLKPYAVNNNYDWEER